MSERDSPRSPLSPYRAYTSYLTPSPKTHALITAPLTRLARRTTDLVETITGGAAAVDEQERAKERTERERLNTCRGCKVVFAGERELTKHHHLFPSHLEDVEARRQGRRPRHLRHASGPAALSLHGTSSGGHVRRSKSRSRARRAPPTSRYVDAEGDFDFENIGPDGVRPSPIQSRSGPPRADAPPPLIDYASRNEAQGRESAARAAAEEELRRLARTAHQERRGQDEQNGVNRRGNARAALAQGMRRGLSDGMLAALATMPTRPDARPSVPQQSFRERTAHLPFTFNPVTGEVDSDSDREWDQESSAIHGETRPLQHAPTMASFGTGSSEQNEALRHLSLRGASPAPPRSDSAAPGWISPTQTLVDDPLPLYSNGPRPLPPAPSYEASQQIPQGTSDEPHQAPVAQISEQAQREGPSSATPASARSEMRPRTRTDSSRGPRRSRSPPATPRYNLGRPSANPLHDTPEGPSSPGLVSPASSGYPQTPRTPVGVGNVAFQLPGRRPSDSPAPQHPSQARTISSPNLVRKSSRPLLMTQNLAASGASLNPFYDRGPYPMPASGVTSSSAGAGTGRGLQNPWQGTGGGAGAEAEYLPQLAGLSVSVQAGAPAFPPMQVRPAPPPQIERQRTRSRGSR